MPAAAAGTSVQQADQCSTAPCYRDANVRGNGGRGPQPEAGSALSGRLRQLAHCGLEDRELVPAPRRGAKVFPEANGRIRPGLRRSLQRQSANGLAGFVGAGADLRGTHPGRPGTRNLKRGPSGTGPGREAYRPATVSAGAVQWKGSAAATAASTGPPRARFPNPVANTTN